MKRTKRFWLGLAALVVVGLGAAYAVRQALAPPEPGAATPAGAMPVETGSAVRAEGRVVPRQEAMLAFLSGGAVVAVDVAEGDGVQAGDPLMRLESTDEALALRAATAAVALAGAHLAGAEAGLRQAQIGLEAARLAARDAEADLALLLAGPTDEQIALAESEVALAAAGVEQAAGSRAVALEGATRADLAAAEAQVTLAQTAYDSAVERYQPIAQSEDSDPAEREEAAWQLQAAAAALAAAQAELDRARAGATRAEQTAANSGVTAAAQGREAAQAELDLLLAGPRAEQIDLAEAGVAGAEAAVAQAEGGVTGAETAVAGAEAALLEAQAGMAAAEEALAQRTLRAPFAGTVAAVNARAGETVAPGVPAIVLADFSRWQIETTDLTELDVVAVAEGLPVAVQLDAFPGETLRGEVSDVAPSPVDVLGDVTYRTTIALPDGMDLPLRWGMTALVTILADGERDLPAATADALPAPPVEAEGQVVPARHARQSFEAGGRVTTLWVGEGERVALGDELIALEADAPRRALDQAAARVLAAEAGVLAAGNQRNLAEAAVAMAESALAGARASLALTRAGARPEEMATAEAALAAAEAAVTQAEAGREVALDTITTADIAGAEAELAAATADLRAVEDAYQEILDACFDTPDGQTICPLFGPVEEQTRRQLEAARTRQAAAGALLDVLRAGPTVAQRAAAAAGVTLAVAQRDVAQAQLDLLLAGASPEQIAKAEVGVAQAEVGVGLAQAEVAVAETAIARAEAELGAAEAGRDAAQAALDRLTLRATMAGTVARLDIGAGEMVAPGTPVATLADLSGWQVETTDVSELDVPRIAVGDEVAVRFDALPDREVAGRVTRIAAMPGLALGDVVYTVTVQLDERAAELPLRWGMTAVVVFR